MSEWYDGWKESIAIAYWMGAGGASWAAIGRRIGVTPETAKRYYEVHRAHRREARLGRDNRWLLSQDIPFAAAELDDFWGALDAIFFRPRREKRIIDRDWLNRMTGKA